jgi:putative transposase
VTQLVHWYINEHRHSKIRFVTPSQRHTGLDNDLLKRRDVFYQQTRLAHPNRWSADIRNWATIHTMHLTSIRLIPRGNEAKNQIIFTPLGNN